MKKNNEDKSIRICKTWCFILILLIISLITFWGYRNLNWFPDKNRSNFTIKIYYQSGREDTKTFNLPKSTKLSLISNSSRSNLTSIFYSNHKPFGNEFGYLVIGAEDYEIIDIN